MTKEAATMPTATFSYRSAIATDSSTLHTATSDHCVIISEQGGSHRRQKLRRGDRPLV
jgi:hypothetical protein